MELEKITINEINWSQIIFSKCGIHCQSTLDEILVKKTEDLQHFNYCLWAHNGPNPETTREFCRKKSQEAIYVIMPFTTSDSTAGKEIHTYTSFDDGTGIHTLPQKMNPVTGTSSFPKAFCFDKLYELKENFDANILLPYYNSILKNNRINEATQTLKGQNSTACLRLKNTVNNKKILDELSKVIKEDVTTKIYVGRLCEPYHVKLIS
nr:hypothetical protein [uncultured Blautia sp.]